MNSIYNCLNWCECFFLLWSCLSLLCSLVVLLYCFFIVVIIMLCIRMNFFVVVYGVELGLLRLVIVSDLVECKLWVGSFVGFVMMCILLFLVSYLLIWMGILYCIVKLMVFEGWRFKFMIFLDLFLVLFIYIWV